MTRKQRDGELVSDHLWRERIDAWCLSGQTQRLFCLQHGISENLFSRWKVTLAQRERQVAESLMAGRDELVESPLEDLAWTEVVWSPAEPVSAPDGCGFEIVLPRGWSVRLDSGFEAEPLRRLLGVLEGFVC